MDEAKLAGRMIQFIEKLADNETSGVNYKLKSEQFAKSFTRRLSVRDLRTNLSTSNDDIYAAVDLPLPSPSPSGTSSEDEERAKSSGYNQEMENVVTIEMREISNSGSSIHKLSNQKQESRESVENEKQEKEEDEKKKMEKEADVKMQIESDQKEVYASKIVDDVLMKSMYCYYQSQKLMDLQRKLNSVSLSSSRVYKQDIQWPLMKEFTEEVGIIKISEYILMCWKFSESWKFEVNSQTTVPIYLGKSFRYCVLFVNSSRRSPCPLQVINIHFAIDVCYDTSVKNNPVDVSFIFESCRTVNKPGRFTFSQSMLESGSRVKLKVKNDFYKFLINEYSRPR